MFESYRHISNIFGNLELQYEFSIIKKHYKQQIKPLFHTTCKSKF